MWACLYVNKTDGQILNKTQIHNNNNNNHNNDNNKISMKQCFLSHVE